MYLLGVGLIYKLLAALGTADTPPTAYYQLALANPAIGRRARQDRQELPADHTVSRHTPTEIARLVFYARYTVVWHHAPDEDLPEAWFWTVNDRTWRWWDLPCIIEHQDDGGIVHHWHEIIFFDGDVGSDHHRDNDKPAVVSSTRMEVTTDAYDRHGDPAVFEVNYTKAWYRHGKLHRDGDKPATTTGTDTTGDRYWFQNDRLHRDDNKPAMIVTRDGREVTHSFVHNQSTTLEHPGRARSRRAALGEPDLPA